VIVPLGHPWEAIVFACDSAKLTPLEGQNTSVFGGVCPEQPTMTAVSINIMKHFINLTL